MNAITVKVNWIKSIVLLLICVLPMLGAEQQKANADKPASMTFTHSLDHATNANLSADGRRRLPVWQNFSPESRATVVSSSSDDQPQASENLLSQTTKMVSPASATCVALRGMESLTTKNISAF